MMNLSKVFSGRIGSAVLAAFVAVGGAGCKTMPNTDALEAGARHAVGIQGNNVRQGAANALRPVRSGINCDIRDFGDAVVNGARRAMGQDEQNRGSHCGGGAVPAGSPGPRPRTPE